VEVPRSSSSRVASDGAAGKVEVPRSPSSKVASDSAAGKVEVPRSSSSRVASDGAAGKVEVPRSSSSRVASDGAAGKMEVPRSSSSRVASDSAAGKVDVSKSKTLQVPRKAPTAALQTPILSSSSTVIKALSPMAVIVSSDNFTLPSAPKPNAPLIGKTDDRLPPWTAEASRTKIFKTISLRESKLKQVMKPTWHDIIEGTIARKSYMSSGHSWI
jgi:hypothetical protein